MGMKITCDSCGEGTADALCRGCAEGAGRLNVDALHDLVLAIARQRDPDEAFMALDVVIRDCAEADALRDRIAIARTAA